jgi:hypothetical protein
MDMLMMLRKMTFILFIGLISMSTQSCGSNKEGCPAYDQANVKRGRKGELPTTRGNSNLFPKDMRKQK